MTNENETDDQEIARYKIVTGGYEAWHDRETDTQVFVHQLLAIANGDDPYVVFDPATNVHHKNGVKEDNHTGNVEILERGGHTALHNGDRSKLTPLEKIRVAELFRNGDCKPEVVGKQFDAARRTVYRAVNEVREAGENYAPDGVRA